MKRQNEKPYARRFIFPVFVPGEKGAPSDVPGNFLRRPDAKTGAWSTPWVHPVSADDLNLGTMKRVLNNSEMQLICGALELRQGMRERNKQIVRGAYEKLMPLIMGWADADESVKDFFARGPWAIHYAQAASEAMAMARPVLWWNGKGNKYQFAFFCGGWKSAFFVSFLLERMRVCPCGRIFAAPKGNVWYCKPQHSAYYRLKRWRQKQKKRTKP